MAQRMTGVLFPRPSLWSKPLRMTPLREPEEQETVPAGTGYHACDRAQGPVPARLELKPLFEHFHDNLAIVDTAREQCPRRGQSPVSLRLSAIELACHDGGNRSGQEFPRGAGAEIRIIDDLGGPAAGPLAQTAFGVRLQAPGDPAEQKLLIPGS